MHEPSDSFFTLLEEYFLLTTVLYRPSRKVVEGAAGILFGKGHQVIILVKGCHVCKFGVNSTNSVLSTILDGKNKL